MKREEKEKKRGVLYPLSIINPRTQVRTVKKTLHTDLTFLFSSENNPAELSDPPSQSTLPWQAFQDSNKDTDTYTATREQD